MESTREQDLIRILKGQERVIQEVYSILEEEEKKDDILRAVIHSSLKRRENRIHGLDPARIFDVEDIRRTCLRYRLRFLPSGRFKGNIPVEALHAVRHLEARSETPIGGFRIMAPAKHFQLCDCDSDPLLFVPVGSGSYYLVHQWGREMNPLRAFLAWPVRNAKHLIATVLAFALVLASLIPTAWLTTDVASGWLVTNRLAAFTCITLMTCAVTAFSWFAFFGQFSEECWDSKTFN